MHTLVIGYSQYILVNALTYSLTFINEYNVL